MDMYFEKYAANKQDITMPSKLKNILSSAGLGVYFKPFSSSRKDCVELSYNGVLGRGIVNLTEKILRYTHDVSKVNTEELLISKNDQEVQKIIKYMQTQYFEDIPKETKIERKLMLSGATMPIKINFIHDALITRSTYVKKPDTNRLIGLALYNLIQNDTRINFAYNEKIFVEQEIKGNNLLEEYDELLLELPEYRDGLGRAAARSEFLGLYEDVVAERNRIVDNQYKTVLFDFDAIFEPLQKGQRGNHLLMHYADKQKIDATIVRAYRDEKRNIAKNIAQYKDIIIPFAEQANKLKDTEYGTIKQKIQEFSGHTCLKDYIINQARKFSQ
ncbi:MAG: hypothetical protein ACLFN8_01520 [Candidatus Woesearchaeota archaeon]